MRIALLTDIHANREALEAVLALVAQRGADQIVCLGDIVGYGADPCWCVDTIAGLHEKGAIVVKGNHDHAIAEPSERTNPVARAALDWTRTKLNAPQAAFLAALPLTHRLGGALLVHANAWAPQDWGYVFGAREAERSMDRTDAPMTFCGHTHVPALYHCAPQKPASAFTPVAGVLTPLAASMRWLAVIGSVGQPRDGKPAAALAFLDLDQRRLTFERIAYDVETAARKVRAARLPEVLAERLLRGV